MTKIAFIHNSFPAGGAERITIDIARYLSTLDGYEVFVYATRIAASLMPEDIDRLITIRQIPSQAIQSVRSQHIEKLLLADGIDILVSVGKSIHNIRRIKERTGVKTVLACHGEPFWQRYVITHRRQKVFLLQNEKKPFSLPLYELDRQTGIDHRSAVLIPGSGFLERSRFVFSDLEILTGTLLFHQMILPAAGLRTCTAVAVASGHIVAEQASAGETDAHCTVNKRLKLKL